jgi:hypothetical protein
VIKIPCQIISLEPLSADRAFPKNRKIFFTLSVQNPLHSPFDKALRDPEGGEEVLGRGKFWPPIATKPQPTGKMSNGDRLAHDCLRQFVQGLNHAIWITLC